MVPERRAVSAPRCSLVEDILEYFLRNPEMRDTVAGVLQWRLLEESARRHVEDGREAFQFLLDRGFLCRVPVASAKEELFGLDLRRRDEAVRYLAAARGPRS